jgi:hypothetical protein
MLYAYPTTGGGIVPMMGPDGVYKKLMEHPSVDSWETTVYPEDGTAQPTHATTKIYLKGKDHPISYTAYFGEWKVSTNPNWSSRPRHMLGLRSLKQAARQVIHGLPYDEDDKVIGDLVNVTGTAESGGEGNGEGGGEKRKEPPARSKKGVAAATENAPVASKTAAASNVIEAEIVPPSAEKKVDPAAPAKTAEPLEVVAEKTAPAEIVLADAQTVTVEGVRVVEVVTKVLNGKPNSVVATVAGAYTGTVYHMEGGGPKWQTEQPVTLKLTGKKLKNGSIAAVVDSIELTDLAPAGGETLE